MQITQTLNDDRVMSLVELALSRPRAERASFLESACAGDTGLLAAVWNYVQAEERMKGFLLDPLCPAPVNEQPFEPGELVDGRFRILREVARGGMGVVYEVTDEKLERRVAIKCAREGFHRRLPPEVRNAREISHPNVCRIFEMHTAASARGEIDFITMEFLEGETLSSRLAAGPLTEPEAREIALQLCAGLEEAHRNHVIHGDLKTGNVILTTDAGGALRAVITDFGMARGFDTQAPEAGGTPDYMAPELWKGERASIASDIYALGVVLFELVSGKRPHAAEKSWPRISWEERLAWRPPAVHPKWDRILARCLDPDPARRFSGADGIAKAFAPPRSRRWILLTAAAAVVVAASGVIVVERAMAPKESVRLALLPFDTQTGGETAQLAGRLLPGTATQLTRLKGNTHTRFAFLAGKGASDQATQLLRASLASENGKTVISAYLADKRSGVKLKEWKAEYAPGEERFIPVALAGLVTETLHLAPPAMPVAVNAAARHDYEMGLRYTRQNSTIDAALPLLERAVAADPDSPLTHAGLAEGQWFKFNVSNEKVWLDRMAESLRRAEIRDPDLAPVHRIEGLLKKEDGRYEQAVAEYQRAIELDPNNSEAWRRLGKVYEAINQLDQAGAAYRRAVELDPGSLRPYQALGAFYYHSGNYAEAAPQFEKTVAVAPNEADAHFALGTDYLALGEYVHAEDELRFALRLSETPETLNNLGQTLLLRGSDREAIAYFVRAVKLSSEQSSLLYVSLADAYRHIGRIAESKRASRRGLELAQQEESRDARDGRAKSRVAYLCARLGDSARAETELKQALDLSESDADTLFIAAVTYEVLGERNKTLDVLSGSPVGVLKDLSRWPDVADLHRDSRFWELLAKGQAK